MRAAFYLILVAAAIMLLFAGCAKTETAPAPGQQGQLQQQQAVPETPGGSEAEAAQNLSDGLDEALAELDIIG